MRETINEFIRSSFAASAGMAVSEIFDADLTLAEIVHRSPLMTNSVDLMEGFAKTANGIRRQYGHRVRLPAFTLESRVSVVLDAIVDQVAPGAGEGSGAVKGGPGHAR